MSKPPTPHPLKKGSASTTGAMNKSPKHSSKQRITEDKKKKNEEEKKKKKEEDKGNEDVKGKLKPLT